MAREKRRCHTLLFEKLKLLWLGHLIVDEEVLSVHGARCDKLPIH